MNNDVRALKATPAYVVPLAFDGIDLEPARSWLIECLQWEVHDVGRKECFFKRKDSDYQYGVGRGMRPYYLQPEPSTLKALWAAVEAVTGHSYEACFINYYVDDAGNLGWHSDDSPSIDQKRPVVILSLGASRALQFRPYADKMAVEEVLLDDGDLLVMSPGMQTTHQHQAPRSNQLCGPRLSFVFRGLR